MDLILYFGWSSDPKDLGSRTLISSSDDVGLGSLFRLRRTSVFDSSLALSVQTCPLTHLACNVINIWLTKATAANNAT